MRVFVGELRCVACMQGASRSTVGGWGIECMLTFAWGCWRNLALTTVERRSDEGSDLLYFDEVVHLQWLRTRYRVAGLLIFACAALDAVWLRVNQLREFRDEISRLFELARW